MQTFSGPRIQSDCVRPSSGPRLPMHNATRASGFQVSREQSTDAPALDHRIVLHGRSPRAFSSIGSGDASNLATLACAGLGMATQSLQMGPYWDHPDIVGKVVREGSCKAVLSWSHCLWGCQPSCYVGLFCYDACFRASQLLQLFLAHKP